MPASGNVLVTLTAAITPTSGNTAFMSVTTSGSCSSGVSDTTSLAFGTNPGQASATYVLTGLSPGSHTLTACYRVSGGGNAAFSNRGIIVTPIS